jgi:glyoxylase-like metal-dependent hydrolase (beta-lactamase superfamily II)
MHRFALLALAVLAPPTAYDASLLASVRSLARAVPGALPTAVGYLAVQDDSGPASNAVDGAPHTNLFEVTCAFQIRYPSGWIMVDAGYGKNVTGVSGRYYADRYDQIVSALRGARLIVVTHEHGDHVGTLLDPAVARDVASKTMLTRQQVSTLIDRPANGTMLDSASARRYLVVDYDRALPIAPGVVLIRAPGHTPGSQMVYVRLASGRELLLVGDVVWRMLAIEMLRQKPESTSAQMGEDRATLAQQLVWLKTVVAPAGVTIVVSHDGTELESLSKQGILANGLALGRATQRVRP